MTRRAVVMGLGSFGGGLGATRHLAREGWRVLVTDLRPAEELRESLAGLEGLDVELALGGHEEEDFRGADLVVANPAVSPRHPLLEEARRSGARVTSAIELFLERVHARLVCVTGTQGKSSTCHALTTLLSACGRRARVGGNIGGTLLDEVDTIEPDEFVVLELSSYQLEALADPRALGRRADRVEAVCVTNVLADHLERHGSRSAYAEAKRRIVDLVAPGGAAILPADEELSAWAPGEGRRVTRSLEPSAGDLVLEGDAFRLDGETLGRLEDLALPGEFQRENALSALGLGRLLGLAPGELARALPRVRGLEHRLEPLGEVAGVRVHDNAVSTTPDSTVAALRSLAPGAHLVLGGRRKDLPYDELWQVARERGARCVTFGEAGPGLADDLAHAGVEVRVAEDVEEAVRAALAGARPGEELLFSPACSSFDRYPNFRARALAFRTALREAELDETGGER